MTREEFLEIRRAIPFEEVRLGHSELALLPIAELDGVQILETGEEDGAWKPDWFVVGEDCLCGDFIFVDLGNSDLPVFVVPHGEGRWDPDLIASSFGGFIEALRVLDRVSKQKRTQVEFAEYPLSRIERGEVLKQIATTIGDAPLAFWELWLGDPPPRLCSACRRPIDEGRACCIFCGGEPA